MDLLRRFNQLAGRGGPGVADAVTPDVKYQLLADAQASVLTKIQSIIPRVLYGAPTAMTSADGGYTWTFGTDGDGYALFPVGKVQIYMDLTSVPFAPLRPGIDYLDEGTQIRMPNNTPWTGTLYFQGMTAPALMSASVQPVLQPPPARILIVIEAVRDFAESAARNEALVAAMDRRWDREFGPAMTAIRTHFRGHASPNGMRGGTVALPYGGNWSRFYG